MSITAKLFINGKSQAVRIPKAFEFTGTDEVILRKEGAALVILPVRKDWTSFSDLPEADDDFMKDREELLDGDLVKW